MSFLQQWITDNIPVNYLPLLSILIIVGVLMAISLFFWIRFMVCRSKYNKLTEDLQNSSEKFKSEFRTAYHIFGQNIIRRVINLIDAEKDLNSQLKGRIYELLQTPGVKFARIENRIKELLEDKETKKEDTPVIKFINEASDLLSEAEKLLNTLGPFLILSVENIEHAERLKRQMEELPTEYKLTLSSTDIEDTKSEPQPKNNDG
ncbi:hypothetical protein KAR28_02065 [Candidatus Parcubacteria bacterium]|nr:hypothetical protein [Candidatus Parcubacteria bacterium]